MSKMDRTFHEDDESKSDMRLFAFENAAFLNNILCLLPQPEFLENIELLGRIYKKNKSVTVTEGLKNLPSSITHRETKAFILSERRLYIKMARVKTSLEREENILFYF